MTIQLIGAGLPRTGTNSLKLALEQLLGGPCYHMHEVFERPHDQPIWEAATRDQFPDWPSFLKEFHAAVDFPSSLYWQQLANAFPDAPILLSTRKDPETWWASVSKTVIPATLQAEDTPWRRMALALFESFIGASDIENGERMMAAYEAHNLHVKTSVAASRLIEWQPEDGWQKICAALNIPVPNEAFPHVNTQAEFVNRLGDDVPAPKP